jgi:hypothetical protein
LAPGTTAPLGSDIVPLIVPRNSCAQSALVEHANNNAITVMKRRKPKIRTLFIHSSPRFGAYPTLNSG